MLNQLHVLELQEWHSRILLIIYSRSTLYFDYQRNSFSSQRNTFQCAIITDGQSTFSIFNYYDIQWSEFNTKMCSFNFEPKESEQNCTNAGKHYAMVIMRHLVGFRIFWRVHNIFYFYFSWGSTEVKVVVLPLYPILTLTWYWILMIRVAAWHQADSYIKYHSIISLEEVVLMIPY